MGIQVQPGFFPDPATAAALLSEIRASARSLLPYPVRPLTVVDGAATIIGYKLLSQFDNSLTVAIHSPDLSHLSAPAEAILTRAVGYAPESIDPALLSTPQEGYISLSNMAKAWAESVCGREYAQISLSRAASDLVAAEYGKGPTESYRALASTLYLVSLEE